MPTVIMTTWACNAWAQLQSDRAVVQIDREYAEYLLACMELAQQIGQSHGDLYCLEFHDGAAIWYEFDWRLHELCEDGYAVIPDGALPAGLDRMTAECPTVRISDHDVHWVAIVEDVERETFCLDRVLVEKIMQGEACAEWTWRDALKIAATVQEEM